MVFLLPNIFTTGKCQGLVTTNIFSTATPSKSCSIFQDATNLEVILPSVISSAAIFD